MELRTIQCWTELLRRIAEALEASVKLAEEANKRTAEFADRLAKLP